MKDRAKTIIMNHPLLKKWVRIAMKPKLLFNLRQKRIVKGRRNDIQIHASSILYSCTFDIVGDDNEIIISDSCILNNTTFFLRGSNNKILINNGVKFHGGGSIWIEDYECQLSIGKNTTFENAHIAVTEPKSIVTIGNDCMFAYDIDVRTGDSHSIISTITNKRTNYAKNINIGNHVWIASHVSILKGVTLPDNSIVATRSVVTNSFYNSNILIGGSPSKIIKEHITWSRERSYL
jgi:acetyltransferase-like isoleucine patch superfamily enzyme